MFQIMVVDDDRNTRRLLQAVLEADAAAQSVSPSENR